MRLIPNYITMFNKFKEFIKFLKNTNIYKYIFKTKPNKYIKYNKYNKFKFAYHNNLIKINELRKEINKLKSHIRYYKRLHWKIKNTKKN